MSWVEQPIKIAVTWGDEGGTTSRTEIFCSPTHLSQAVAFAETYMAKTAALSDCTALSYEVVLTSVLVDTTIWPAAGATNSDAGVFIFDTDVSTLALLALPGFKADLLATTGDYAGVEIDQTLTNVANWLAVVVNGVSGVHPQSPLGETIGALSVCYLQHR
jgi:hypothetical protein